MEFKDIYQNIDWKALIIGAGIFAFTVLTAIEWKLDILLVFASAGLLYIGYTSQNRLQSLVLGAIGVIPLVLANLFFHLLTPSISVNANIIIIISFLAIGVFCGFAGFHFKTMRNRAIEEKEKKNQLEKVEKRKIEKKRKIRKIRKTFKKRKIRKIFKKN